MLSRFHLIPEHHGQTDGQNTNSYINTARQCAYTQYKLQLCGYPTMKKF